MTPGVPLSRRLSIGLVGRLLAILLVTVGGEFAVSTWLYERSSRMLVEDDEAHRLAEHLVVARALVASQPLPERPAMAARLTTDRYDVHWGGATSSPPAGDPGSAAMARRVIGWEPELAGSDLRLRLATRGRGAQIFGGLRLPDGTWLRFRAAAPAEGDDLAYHRLAATLLPAAILLLIGAAMFRHTLRPMRMLARAAEEIGAERIGSGREVILPEAGPREVVAVIHAFNAMQARIHRLIDERTQGLAAVGHDLRTPLARMRLRSENIAEAEVRAAFEADVGEMDGMVASLLAFLGGEDDPEPRSRVDLAVIAATLADAAADAGQAVSYHGPDHCEASVRPVALRRALANLIDNAVSYGGAARVVLGEAPGGLVLAVEDDGPGIPAAELERVLEPFARLDHARARNTKGLGLGLAIVARAVAANGGTLALANRAEGGLRATIRLPV